MWLSGNRFRIPFMDILQMFAYILQHQGGTFRAIGDGTFDRLDANTGYVISKRGYLEKVYITDFTSDVLEDYVSTIDPGIMFGAWIEDSYVYLDYSDYVATIDETARLIGGEFESLREIARMLGRIREQIAIWDCEHNESVVL